MMMSESEQSAEKERQRMILNTVKNKENLTAKVKSLRRKKNLFFVLYHFRIQTH